MTERATTSSSEVLEQLALRPDVHEERFDRLTRLAKRLFRVEIVVVAVFDDQRSWFKSSQGVDVPYAPRREGDEQWVHSPDPVVVEDLSLDPRYRDHPDVNGEAAALRFFASVPLDVGGLRVGALCVVDSRPREFGEQRLAQLREIGSMVERELGDSDELDRAAEIQRSLLPKQPPSAPGWEFSAFCIPARSIGGDFVDWQHGPDGTVDMTLADVMGKGVGAGIVAATVRAAIRTATRGSSGPGQTLTRVGETVEDDLDRTGSLVTLLQGRLDPASGEFWWADAGHGLQLNVRASGAVERLVSGDLPLGAVPGDTWSQGRTRFEPGDLNIAFSDGLLDLYDGTLAALDEIVQVCRSAPDGPDGVIRHFAQLAQRRPLLDDVTVVCFRRTA